MGKPWTSIWKSMDIHGKAIGNPWVIDGNPSDSGYGFNGRGYPAPFVKTPVVPPKRTGVSYKNSRQLRFRWKQHVSGHIGRRIGQCSAWGVRKSCESAGVGIAF